MNQIAYFIGGPLDLTKQAIKSVERKLYALTIPSLTLNEVHTVQDARYAMDLIKSRHVYLHRGECRVAYIRDAFHIYMYDGLESDKP